MVRKMMLDHRRLYDRFTARGQTGNAQSSAATLSKNE
jgi:hypothetical protein